MEKFHQGLAPKKIFFYRVLWSTGLGTAFLCAALFVGMLGYHFLEHMSWVDAYANAAMILSGMGPLVPLSSTSGKIFAGTYALFSGLVFIMVMGIIFAPIVHRWFHKWHLDDNAKSRGGRKG
ncbi:MAG: hypothetical protein WAW86_01510 [Gammaproteobacteria bacterium]